jgi:hypothetical protein
MWVMPRVRAVAAAQADSSAMEARNRGIWVAMRRRVPRRAYVMGVPGFSSRVMPGRPPRAEWSQAAAVPRLATKTSAPDAAAASMRGVVRVAWPIPQSRMAKRMRGRFMGWKFCKFGRP